MRSRAGCVCNSSTHAASVLVPLHPPRTADAAYNEAQDAAFGPGSMSTGFLTAARAVWDGGFGHDLQAAIKGGTRNVLIVGQSLGGAAAKLLGVRAQVTWALLQGEALMGQRC